MRLHILARRAQMHYQGALGVNTRPNRGGSITWEAQALYWYPRGNGRNAGVDIFTFTEGDPSSAEFHRFAERHIAHVVERDDYFFVDDYVPKAKGERAIRLIKAYATLVAAGEGAVATTPRRKDGDWNLEEAVNG